MEQINKLNDELISFLIEYERSCIESYLNKNKPLIKEDINKKLNDELIEFIRDY